MSQHESQGDALGQSTPAADAAPSGRPRRRFRLLSWLIGSVLLVIYAGVALGVAFLGATLRPAYLPATPGAASQIFSSDGKPLARIFDESHMPVKLSDVPVQTIYALLAAEDADFFTHKGLDWPHLLREAQHPWHAQTTGGTLTEQLVRMSWPDNHPSLFHTVREYILAVRVERAYDKFSLLERYLNTVYFGSGAYGLGAAAQIYFGKPVNKLTPAESAALAGVIDMPGEGNPRDNIQMRREQDILALMLRRNWLSQDDYDDAVHEPLQALSYRPIPWAHPYVVDAVRQQLLARYGQNVVYRRGLQVYTTIDARLQDTAEQVLLHTVHLGSAQHVSTGALAAIEPQSGAIRALVGGVNFAQSQYDRAVLAHRQPGSVFNVFVYHAALTQGHLPFDRMLDAPVTVGNWAPKNVGNRYLGVVSLRKALAQSLNSVSVRLTQQLTPQAVVDAAHSAGISSPLAPVLPIALGGDEVTPLEMARAFATYANAGRAIDAGLIREIRMGNRVLYQQQPRIRQTVPPGTAYLLTQALRQVMLQGAGKNAVLGRPAAGNAGRDSDDRNAWFIGYTPDLSTAVWLGNDDHRPMSGVDGSTLPAQAWIAFMTAAHRGVPIHNFPVPADVKLVTLCADSHQLALPTCPHRFQEYLPLARIPTQPCPMHYWVTRKICVESGKLATPRCPVTEERTFAYNAAPTEYCPLKHMPAPAPVVAPQPAEPPAPAVHPVPAETPTPTVSQPAPASPPSPVTTPSTTKPALPAHRKHAVTPSGGNAPEKVHSRKTTHHVKRPTQHTTSAGAGQDTGQSTQQIHHVHVKHQHTATTTPRPASTPRPKVSKPKTSTATPAPPTTTDNGTRAKQTPDEKVQRYSPTE